MIIIEFEIKHKHRKRNSKIDSDDTKLHSKLHMSQQCTGMRLIDDDNTPLNDGTQFQQKKKIIK